MNSEKIAKRKKPWWLILKRISMGIFGLLVVVNIVFCWLQEIFLLGFNMRLEITKHECTNMMRNKERTPNTCAC